MLWIIIGIITSYLLGSIPTAYIFGIWFKGVDIRRYGSGNVGATNALRVLGRIPGLIVLLLDTLKGFLVTVVLADLIIPRITFFSAQTLRIILGVACIAGHNWTVFLGFKGGKGIATTLGVLVGLSLAIAGLKQVLILLILTWVAIFIAGRIVSLASVLAGLSLPFYVFIFKLPRSLLILSIILSVFVLLRHASNIKRLLEGKEPRLK